MGVVDVIMMLWVTMYIGMFTGLCLKRYFMQGVDLYLWNLRIECNCEVDGVKLRY